MTTFFIDEELVLVLATRFDAKATDADEVAATIEARKAAAASGEPLDLTELDDVARSLRQLAVGWRAASDGLQERLKRLEEAELDERTAVAESDLLVDVRAEIRAEFQDFVNDRVGQLIGSTEPLIVEGSPLRRGSRWVRDGRDSERREDFFYFIDADGDVVEVGLDPEDGTVETDGGQTFQLVNGQDDEIIVLIDGQTSAERVLANLAGVGDGSTPDLQALSAQFLGVRDPSTGETSVRPRFEGNPFGDEFLVGVTIGDGGQEVPVDPETGEPLPGSQFNTYEDYTGFLRSIGLGPVADFSDFVVENATDLGTAIAETFAAGVAGVTSFFSGLFGLDDIGDDLTVPPELRDDTGGGDGGGGDDNGGGYDDGWSSGGGYGTDDDGNYDNNYSGI